MKTKRSVRRGAIAPFMAFLTVPLLAMMAFSVDLGWIMKTQADLQNTADAAALAGATAHRYAPPTLTGGGTSPGAPYGLMDGFVLFYTQSPTLTQAQIVSRAKSNSQLYAQYYAYQNSAGSMSNVNLTTSDITFGFLHSDMTTYDEPPSSGTFPNTVHVTVRMDGSSNPALPLFFAPVLGMSTINLTADAYATIFNGPITSLNGNGALLPLTIDLNVWNAYMKYLNSGSPANTAVTSLVTPASGANAFNNTYNLNVAPDPNNFQQLNVFNGDKTIGTAGRGWLSLNNSSVSASSLSGWATNGLSASDVNALTSSTIAGSYNDVLLPLPTSGSGDGSTTHRLNSWDWQADTGVKQSVVGNLPLNTPVLLPLFQPVVPNTDSTYQAGTKDAATDYSNAYGNPPKGVNANLNIVAFVPVVITSTSSDVYVEPSAIVPPGAIFGSLAPANSGASTFYSSFSIPRLTKPGG
jgi:Flp pilus assembly protein TadG